MKPAFALDLDHGRITLLYRSGGGWIPVGAVDTDAPDLDAALAFLRKTGLGLASGALTCKLILPPSQILYREVAAPGPDTRSRKQQIRAALVGMTPYGVDDLVFDWSGTGETVQIAVVARETLNEAEDFASEHRFGPVSFVASPMPGQFAGEPFFGQTRIARQLLPDGERVLRDNEPVRPITVSSATMTGADPAASVPPAASVAPARAATGPITVAVPEKAVTSDRIDTSPPTPPAPDDRDVALPHDLVVNPVGMSEPLPIPPADCETGEDAADEGTQAAKTEDATPPSDDHPEPSPHYAPTAAQITARTTARAPDPHMPAPAVTVPEIAARPKHASRGRVAIAGLLALSIGVGVVWSLNSRPRPEAGHGEIADAAGPAAVPARAAADGATDTTQGARQGAHAGRDTGFAGTSQTDATPEAPAPSVITVLPRRDRTATDASLDVADSVTDHPVVDETAQDFTAAPVPPGQLSRTARDRLPSISPVAARPIRSLSGLNPAAGLPDVSRKNAGDIRVRAPAPPSPPGSQSAGDILLAALDLKIDPNSVLTGNGRALFPAGARDGVPGPVTPPPPAPQMPGAGVSDSGPPDANDSDPDTADTAESSTDPGPDPALAGFRPRARPADLVPPPPDPVAATLAPAEGDLRPRARPQSVVADMAAEAAATAAARAAADSAAAIAASVQPETRPQTYAAPQSTATAAARVGPTPEDDGEPEVTRRAPRIPTRASVAQRATIKKGIVMRDINLIGVFGSSASRRALVRMPDGKLLQVRVGDRIDGGRVAVIEQSRLIYVKGGRDQVLEIPNG